MIHKAEVSGELPEMQLAGRLALSAAALFLLSLAYRYFKSRVSAGAQEGDNAVADPGEDAGPKEDLACDQAGTAGAPQGPRHRRAHSKGAMLNRREPYPARHWDGPAALDTGNRQGAPAGTELNVLIGKEEEEEEEEEEGRAKKEINCPEIRLQPDQECSVPEEEEEKGGETSSSTPSDRSKARTRDEALVAASRDGPTSADRLSQSSHKGPSREAESAGSELCLPPRGKGAGQAPLPASEDGTTLERGKGQLLGEDRRKNVLPTQETLAGQERMQVFHATTNMDLMINQKEAQSNSTHTISSVAEVQVEEKVITARKAKEDNEGQSVFPETGGLRGNVYDYSIQPTSKSVLKEKPSYVTQGTQPPDKRPPTNIPNNHEVQLCQEPAHSLATEDENRTALEEIPSPPSGALFTQDDEDQKKAAREATTSQGPSEARRGFSRKESFHKIVENPELQVQMEGFGSTASGSSSNGKTPPLGHRSSSVTSLVGSMQSLPAGTSEKPTVELVAGAKFFHVPLNSKSSINVHLDLGNCYEALCVAKKQKLEGLREAAFKVMSDNYLQVLRTNAIYGRLNALERDLILQRRMRGRKYVTVADISSPDHPASRLCYYDDQADTWHPLTHMPIEAVSHGCAVCSMFNYLFVVAGCEGRGKYQKPSKRVFCYNPLTNIWREICPLNQARPQCKLVALDGYLYAIGGECLYTVERYDPRLDRWTFASPLPNDTFAVAHTATACDGEIYVTGGTLRYMLLKYVGRTDSWKVTLTGGSKDRTTEMVTTNGFIYRFDLNRRMGISVYRCSSKAKLWYECATHPMPFPACFQCAVVDNLVYCISRQFNIRFLADYISPRFGTKELQNFPSPRGSLFPVTLVLPDREAAQTRV